MVLPLFALANGGIVPALRIAAGHQRPILATTVGLILGEPPGIRATTRIQEHTSSTSPADHGNRSNGSRRSFADEA